MTANNPSVRPYLIVFGLPAVGGLAVGGLIVAGALGAVVGGLAGAAGAYAGARYFLAQEMQYAPMRESLQAEGLELNGFARRGRTEGWLFLTKQRLIFVPGKGQDASKGLEINVVDIRAVSETEGRHLGAVSITTTTETVHFDVAKRVWSTALERHVPRDS